MKKIKIMYWIVFSLVSLLLSCEKEDHQLNAVETPSELTINLDIQGQDDDNPNGDGSGIITVTATANNALSYYFVMNGSKLVVASGVNEYILPVPGINSYQLDVFAVGAGGSTINTSTSFDIAYSFDAPENIIERLTGIPTTDGEVVSKTWRIKSELTGHFGLGPVDGEVPTEWYGASAEEKEGTGMYEDRYTFSSDGTFTHTTEGRVFGREILINELGSTADDETSTQSADVLNMPLDNYSVPFYYTGNEDQVNVLLSGTGFIGYYIGGNHIYEFFQYENQPEDELILRSTDGNGEFDWWFIITSCELNEACAEVEEETLDVEYTDLVWQDEFDTNGAPNTDNWNYDIGRGENGWGNNELQYYTDRSDNVYISDGTLKIVAKRETYEGALYTSTRMKTQGLQEFTYGRIDVRAKLPSGGGTWPAIWTLGSNITEVSWPACGEIDIMEHVGNNQNEILHAIHTPSSFGNTVNKDSSIVATASTNFHVYSINWSQDQISFLVDDEIIYTYNPANKTDENWPFYQDQFIILNIAIGGTLGGNVDSDFMESTMEIDYVRVYQ